MKKNNIKKLLILALILIILIIAIIVLCTKNIEKIDNVKESKLEELEQVISNYNASNNYDKIEIIQKENEDDIILAINNVLTQQDGTKHTSTVNYTKKEVNSIIYDDKNNVLQVVTTFIDEKYNVMGVSVYVYSSGAIHYYDKDDVKLAPYKAMVETVSLELKEVLKDDNTSLFNKKLEDLK